MLPIGQVVGVADEEAAPESTVGMLTPTKVAIPAAANTAPDRRRWRLILSEIRMKEGLHAGCRRRVSRKHHLND